MEKAPRNLAEQYESELSIKLADMPTSVFKNPGTYPFAVSDSMSIFISKISHKYIFDKYGVDSEGTLAEGYVKIKKINGEFFCFVDLKKFPYQSFPAFVGSEVEREIFERAVCTKIRQFVEGSLE